jgi:hypothetical protein
MDERQIRRLLEAIFAELRGDWILVGGALLHALEIATRHTLDIDLVPLGSVTNADQLQIIDIAVKHGFPPETINFAAEYFVKKQPGWNQELVLLRETAKARIYRPSRKLFETLKRARGTETDLEDIEVFEKAIKY